MGRRMRILAAALALCMALALAGCAGGHAPESGEETAPPAAEAEQDRREETADMNMTIGGTAVTVAWEDNPSVEALKELCADGPRTIQLHMYGGFEQVGDIGKSLPRDDRQTTTQAGDIVLYAGDQMVVFYGSNSWAYTRLGHITDQTADGMRQLLGNGDVTVTVTAG